MFMVSSKFYSLDVPCMAVPAQTSQGCGMTVCQIFF